MVKGIFTALLAALALYEDETGVSAAMMNMSMPGTIQGEIEAGIKKSLN